MEELIYTTLVLFGFCLPVFFIFPDFKLMKIFLVFFQLILFIILISDNFYKEQSLYEEKKFKYIQNLTFYPVKSLYKEYFDNGTFSNINFDITNNSVFSLIKTEKYSTKCLENYYIEKNQLCPITDIKLGTKEDNIYQNYIEINDNKYIYYTRENKAGKLYNSFNYSQFKENIEDTIIIENIARKEFNKLSNPIFDFKFYIKFCDILCFLLSLFSLYYTIIEPLKYHKENSIKNINELVQIIIAILHIIRFIKFVEIKTFLFDNKDLYDNDNNEEDYFPNKYFNIDSFPLALSINLFIYNFLFARFPNKISCCENYYCLKKTIYDLDYLLKEKQKDYNEILFLIIPLYITYFILVIFDLLNDKKISNIYNNIIYNWNMNPIQSIN